MSRMTPPPTVPQPRSAILTDLPSFDTGFLRPNARIPPVRSGSKGCGARLLGLAGRFDGGAWHSDPLEPLEPRADPRPDAPLRRRDHFRLPGTDPRMPRVGGNQTGRTRHGIGVVNEERVVVHLVVVSEAVDGDDVTWPIPFPVLEQMRKKVRTLRIRHLFL